MKHLHKSRSLFLQTSSKRNRKSISEVSKRSSSITKNNRKNIYILLENRKKTETISIRHQIHIVLNGHLAFQGVSLRKDRQARPTEESYLAKELRLRYIIRPRIR